MATQTDFWGEIGVIGGQTPLSILREQASLLGTKTQNLIEAQVETEGVVGGLRHIFSLVVPVLGHYTYELFSVWHGVVDLYPVVTNAADRFQADNRVSLKNEDEFKKFLSEKLSSPETKKILSNLLAQARS